MVRQGQPSYGPAQRCRPGPQTGWLAEPFHQFQHTGQLESFHNHLLMYCPKRQSFQFHGYRARNLLAAIDFNFHVNRPEQVDSQGDVRQKPSFNKRSKTWGVENQKIKKTYAYKTDLQAMVFAEKLADSQPTNRSAPLREDDPRRVATSIAKVPRPSKEELVHKHLTRF